MAAETLDPRRYLGRWALDSASHVGRVSLLVADMFRSLSEVRVWFPRMMTEAWNIGVGSLFIVLLISGFAGAVTALQARYQFTGTIPIYYLAGVVVESIVLELGPVLTALCWPGGSLELRPSWNDAAGRLTRWSLGRSLTPRSCRVMPG
jgi:phospholipid/cholesterol/gamma-HCH transport system permease protein